MSIKTKPAVQYVKDNLTVVEDYLAAAKDDAKSIKDPELHKQLDSLKEGVVKVKTHISERINGKLG